MAGCILIVDAMATNRIILKVKLSDACYRVLQAASEQEAMHLARAELPDLILMDHAFAGPGGAGMCRALRADRRTAGIPVMVVTPFDDLAARQVAFGAGADAVLARPLDEVLLLARIRSLLRAAARRREISPRGEAGAALGLAEAPAPRFDRPARIAVIAADAPAAIRLGRRIDASGSFVCQPLEAARALEGLDTARPPDLVMIDPGKGGAARALRLLSDLQSRRDTRGAAFLMMADPADPAASILALDQGLDDLIEAGVPAQELQLRLERQLTRKREIDRLRDALDDGMRMAVTDPLTGLFNRRYALQKLHMIAADAPGTGKTYAVMVLDLDRFKQVNDRYGHAAGDAVLQVVAERIRAALRPDDLVARIGGEEFLVVLPATDLARAQRRAEGLRCAVGGAPVTLPGSGGQIHVTISIGVAIGGGDDARGLPAAAAVEQADRALYMAKSDGRDQVSFSRPAA